LVEMELLQEEDVERIDLEIEQEIVQGMSAGRQQPRIDYDQYVQYAVAEL
jgi:hypothetical protein